MISIERQQGLFIAISKRLKKKISVYSVGGTAMMLLGLKDSTLDIDLVFETAEERKIFIEAIKSLGYEGMDAAIVYGAKSNKPEMLTLGEERFDLFLDEVVDFLFSESMRERAGQTHQFGETLVLKTANPNDILLMKCATDRLKDLDDARKIIENIKVDWNLVVEEAKNQKKLRKEKAIFELGYFLEKLKNKFKLNIPKKILDELWDLLKEEPKKKTRGKKPE